MAVQSTTHQTVESAPNFMDCRRSERQKHVTIFLLSGAMYTSAFCHCQACRVHLFHLAVVKYRQLRVVVRMRCAFLFCLHTV